MEELLWEFFAAERELENDEVLQGIGRRAKEIPRLLSLLPPGAKEPCLTPVSLLIDH